MIVNPKVSILVPIYGVEKFIERCAISLFEQTFQDIEYIFVNDCTPDKSIDVLIKTLERYPHRKSQTQIINHEINRGLAGARNTGVLKALGDYILHVDADDYLELQAIELLYSQAMKFNADIVICNLILRWQNVSKIVEQSIPDHKVDLINKMLSTHLMPGVVNKLFKRSLYVENKIFAIEGINMGEDYITTPRLIYYSNKVAHLNLPLYNYVQYNSGSYTKVISIKSCQDIINGFEIIDNFFKIKKDYSSYTKAINQGKLIKKIELLERAPLENLKELGSVFPELNYLDIEKLNFNQKIILYLNNKKKYNLMNIYLLIFKSFYSLVQIVKRR